MNQNENLHILLADDDEDDRLFFRDAVEKVTKRTRMTFMNDGVQLMDYLTKENTTLPQVVFLDLNMPKKSGMECLKEIRSRSALNDLSVAIYSTSSAEEDIEETFAEGANIYIRKPRDFGKLKKIMAEVLSLNWKYHTTGRNRDNYLLIV